MAYTIEWATLPIPLGRNGKFGTLQVETHKFNDHVHLHVYEYGLRQILNDAMADKTDDDGNALPDAEIVAKAQKRLDALYAGQLRMRVAGDAEPRDPVEAEVYRFITGIAKQKYSGKGKLLDKINAARDGTPYPTLQAFVDDVMAKSPNAAKIRRDAQRRVKERDEADLAGVM